jgi:hypothetical protein
VDIVEVRAAVEETFDRLGASTPGWPNPRPDYREARPEEYSRCLDREKYRIVGTRTRAWVAALTDLGLAVADESPLGIRLRPTRAVAVPLLLELMEHQGVAEAFLVIRAGDRGVEISRHPDCGCDACDFGSEELIAHLDDEIEHVVSGGLVHVEAPGFTARTTADGWSAEGLGADAVSVPDLLAEAAAGRSPYPVIRGPAWW